MKKFRAWKQMFLVIVFLGIGGFLGYRGVKPLAIRFLTEPVSLDELDYKNLQGAYVKAPIYCIYGYYAETVDSNNRIKSREYVIDGDDYHYIGMLSNGRQMKKADTLMQACWDYWDYKIGDKELQLVQYEVVGTIEKMPTESARFFREYLSLDKEQQDMVVSYYLVTGKVGGAYISSSLLFCGGALFFVFHALKILVDAFTGHDRAIKKFMTAANVPGLEEKVKTFLEHTQDIGGIQINKDFIFMHSKGLKYYLNYSANLVWAYKSITTHRTNGIPTGTTYALMFKFLDKKTYALAVKTEEECHKLLQQVAPFCPRAVYGYDQELEKLYKNRFNDFLNIRYNIEAPIGEYQQEKDESI